MALLVGVVLVFIIPFGAGNDEQAHVFRAYNISHGALISQPLGVVRGHTMYGGPLAKSLDALEAQVAWAKARHCNPSTLVCARPSAAYDAETARLAGQRLNQEVVSNDSARGAAGYFFVAYIPVAVAFRLAAWINTSVGHAIVLGRLASLISYVIIVGFALFLLRRSSVRWMLLAVALMPISMVAGASITADTLIIAGSLLLFALCARALLDRKLSRPLLVLLIAIAVLLPLIKLPYAVLSLSVLFLPLFPQGWRGYAWRLALVLCVLLPALGWLAVTQDMNLTQSALTHAGSSAPNMNHQVIYIVTHPIAYAVVFVHSMIAKGWVWILGTPLTNNQRVPITKSLVLALYAVLALAAMLASQDVLSMRNRRYIAIFMTVAGSLTIIGAATALYGIYAPVGYKFIESLEGRYLVPALPFLLLGLASWFRIKLPASRYWPAVMIGSSVFVLFATIGWYYAQVYIWSV